MKTRFLACFSTLFLLFSCETSEDPSANSLMSGRWEQIFEVQGLYLSHHFIEFKEDGTFHREGTARDLETGDLIGYRGIADGSFQVNDGIVTLTEEVLLNRDYDDPAFIDDNSFFPKEALIPSDDTSEVYYWVRNNFTELHFMCPDQPTDCTEFITYVKVTGS